MTAACFCKAAENPGKKALACLAALLCNSYHEDWGPAVLAFGPVLSWPQARLRITRRCFCVVIGQLWRKLLFPWTQYPWKLAVLVDEAATGAEKQACAQALFKDPACCLDGFSRKLREVLENPEALLQDDTLHFLSAVFARIVPTSTFIERMFSRLTDWSKGKLRGPKSRLSVIASKHCSHTFKQCVNRWRNKILKQKATKQHNRRPAWVRTKNAGKRQNGWSLFQKDYCQQHPELARLPVPARNAAMKHAWEQADKRAWARAAKAANLQAAAAADADAPDPAEICGGPWGIGTSTGFPLARHVVASKCNKVKEEAACFHAENNVLQPEAGDSFVDAPPQPWPLFPVCTVNACQRGMPERCRPTMERLRTLFWKVVLRHAPRSKTASRGPLLVAYSSRQKNECVAFAVAFHTLRAPLQAALIRLQQQEDPVMAAAGILPCHCSSTVAGAPELQLQSEAEALGQLARVAGDWQMELLTAGPVSVLGRFDVVARCPASGDTEEQQPLNEEAQAALRAFELLQPKRQKPKSKPPDSAGPGPSEEKQPRQKKSRKKAKSQSALKLLEEKKLQGMLQLDSESESALMPEDESASEDAPPAREIPLLEETSDQGDGPVASSSSSARDAGAQASSQVSALHAPGHKRHTKRRGEAWGIFFISPLYRSGQQVGWEALCNLHSDQHDKQGTSCKKSISQTTGVSAAECKLRLKRWLVAGLDDAKWGEDCKRSAHISLGGALLRQYAAGLSEAELDAKAKHVG